MMRRKHFVRSGVAVAAMTLLLPATAQNHAGNGAPAFKTDSIPDYVRRGYDYHFLEAVRLMNAGDDNRAAALLDSCIAMKPEAAEAYYLRARIRAEQQNDSLSMADMQRAAALNPANSTYQEGVAIHYLNSRRYAEATKAYEALYAKNRDRTDVLNLLIQLYQQQKNYDGMLDAIGRLEVKEGNSEEITLSKMRVYEMRGDKKSARRVLQQLCNEHPIDVGYRVMMGNWLMQNDRSKEAFKIFTAALKEEPDNTYAQSSMRDYYRAAGQTAEADALTEHMLMSSKTSSEDRQTLLRQLIQEGEQQGQDSMALVRTFDRVLQHNPTDAATAELAAAYMTLKKMPQDSIDRALTRVLAISPDNAGARLQLIQTLWPKKDWDGIIKLCNPALLYNPDEMAFYYFKGLAHYQKDERDEALQTFQKGVSQINAESNHDIVSDFYAIMGDILYQKGKTSAAFAAYDSCLQWKPDNMACLNNYAYYLSVGVHDLKKAEEMSFRTIRKEGKNATYLDTYAWILFLQMRYEEAGIYIDQALRNDTDSVKNNIILEHAGDIQAVLGHTDKAVEYWREAVTAGNENATLQRKIKLRKYISE